MDRIEQAARRAEQAHALRSNPLHQQAFADVRQGILDAWSRLGTADSEGARDLHRMLRCLERVQKCIDTHIDTGTLAQHELEGRRRLAIFHRRA